MSETYMLSWSRMFSVGSDSYADVPDVAGIYRVWSALGQCLYVGGASSIQDGLVSFVQAVNSAGLCAHVAGCHKMYADWARVPDTLEVARVRLAETKRLRPRWAWPV